MIVGSAAWASAVPARRWRRFRLAGVGEVVCLYACLRVVSLGERAHPRRAVIGHLDISVDQIDRGGRTVPSGVKAGGARTDLSGSSYRERLAPAPGAL